MDPLNQPGVLGFAYVPIDAGAIVTEDLVMSGVIGSVVRTGAGTFEIHVFDYAAGADLVWPWGFAFGIMSDTALAPTIAWHTGVGDSNPIIFLRGNDNNPADPSGDNPGFTISILPT